MFDFNTLEAQRMRIVGSRTRDSLPRLDHVFDVGWSVPEIFRSFRGQDTAAT